MLAARKQKIYDLCVKYGTYAQPPEKKQRIQC